MLRLLLIAYVVIAAGAIRTSSSDRFYDIHKSGVVCKRESPMMPCWNHTDATLNSST